MDLQFINTQAMIQPPAWSSSDVRKIKSIKGVTGIRGDERILWAVPLTEMAIWMFIVD